MSKFDVKKLIRDVFQLVPEDRVTILVDLPHDKIKDIPHWEKRRRLMVPEWYEGFGGLAGERGFGLNPVVYFKATGVDGKGLPRLGEMDKKEVILKDVINSSTVVVALTEWSASSTLFNLCEEKPGLRVASMPAILFEMEETALCADYKEVAGLCEDLKGILKGAVGAGVVFSTGHGCYFDLRGREAHVDNGMLPPDKKGHRVINLPSGEVFIAPYEGEIEGKASMTEGELPVSYRGELVVYSVKGNKIAGIEGSGEKASEMRAYFKEDDARRNIAEFGLGCNECAVVRESDDPDTLRANELEDEKAGFHWAYGLSDHFGGVWGEDKFKNPQNAVHKDIIYAPGSPIEVKSITLFYADGSSRNIWDGKWYTV